MINQIRKWDIYFCNLCPAQIQKEKIKNETETTQCPRPVIVISNDAVNYNLPVSAVIPLSSVAPDEKIYPTEVYLPSHITELGKHSVAMIHQVGTMPHSRIFSKAGEITDEEYREKILYAIELFFEL